MKRLIKVTEDGSPTIYLPALKEHYHSVHGAVQESMLVYVERSISRSAKTNIRLFEAGFGTGLNAWLSCIEAGKTNKTISYHSVELYPVEKHIWKRYIEFFNNDSWSAAVFNRIHQCEWDTEVDITRFFRLKKIYADLTTYIPEGLYDVVYFDAFGPKVQPEMWTKDVFSRISAMMAGSAILCTYSSGGEVGRNMAAAGLSVNRVPGPPGKMEMIVAVKP